MSTEQFELLFEGPQDDSAPTLRRIKGVFVADLDFPASDVQRFLDSAPITIKTASSESELKAPFDLLNKAGAKVLIVNKTKEPQLELEILPLEAQEEEIKQDNPKLPSKNSGIDLEPLSLDFEPISHGTTKGMVQASEPVEALELSLDFDLAPIEPSQIETPKLNTKAELETGDDLFINLTLEEPNLPETKATSFEEPERPESNENKIEPETKIEAESNAKITEPSQSALELEVVAPETSTLFSPEQGDGIEVSDEVAIKSHEGSNIPAVNESDQPAPLNSQPSLIQESKSEPKVFEEEQEDAVELTLDELKALQKPPKNRKNISALPILVLLIVAMLYFINKSLFMKNIEENPFNAILKSIPIISSEEAEKERAAQLAKKTAELNENLWYATVQNYSNRSFESKIWVEKDLPIHGTIELTTPEPAPLTKEEIVNHVPPRAWLKRLEIKDLEFKRTADKIEARGPAHAYISVGEKNIRISGYVSVLAKINEDKSKLFLEVRASSELSATTDNGQQNLSKLEFSIDNADPGSARSFSYNENIELEKK